MTKPTKIVVNCTTGEQTIEELTDEEIAQMEIDRATHAALQAEREAQEQAKAESKASAISKLTALGLTEDEVASLL
jgi:DNA-binding transcriptional regulator YhcF (GntR family)